MRMTEQSLQHEQAAKGMPHYSLSAVINGKLTFHLRLQILLDEGNELIDAAQLRPRLAPGPGII